MTPYYQKTHQKIFAQIKKANYEKAFELATLSHKSLSPYFYADLDYYSVMADYGSILGGAKGRRLHRRGVVGLKSLMYRLRGVDPNIRNIARNEYYFQTKQYKAQYELGINEFNRTHNLKAMYSCGVGAVWYANELLKKRQKKRSVSWAKKSILCWQKYLKAFPDYYNPYVHYALALGLTGELDKAKGALEMAQALSSKPRSFEEFQEIRLIIKI